MMYMTVEVKCRNVPEPSPPRRFPPFPILPCVGDVGYIRPTSIAQPRVLNNAPFEARNGNNSCLAMKTFRPTKHQFATPPTTYVRKVLCTENPAPFLRPREYLHLPR